MTINSYIAKYCLFSSDGFQCKDATLSSEDLLNGNTQNGVFVGFACNKQYWGSGIPHVDNYSNQ